MMSETPEWATLWANVQIGKVPFYYMGRGGVVDQAYDNSSAAMHASEHGPAIASRWK